MQKIIFLFLAFIFLATPLAAQTWDFHRQTVLAQPSLIRYHLFDGAQTSPNLAPSKDVEDSGLVYRTEHHLEAVAGPFADSKAVRLDAGFFEGPKLALERPFSVEMRVRLLGAGTRKGNNNSDNGTLYGLGNGWDQGIRLTTDCIRQTLTFSIGRPEDAKSRNAFLALPVPYGSWLHIANTWDGETMRIYVDGILCTIIDFDGILTEPHWGFRIGYNGAGVGSVKMDVAEVAVYKAALSPEEILAHTLLLPKLPEEHTALLHSAIDAIRQQDYTVAEVRIKELLAREMPAPYRYSMRRFQAELAAMSGNVSQTLRLSALLLNEPDLPPNFADGLMRRLIPADSLNPIAVAPSAVYRKILDDSSFNLNPRQQFAMERGYATARFVENPLDEKNTAEAAKLLAGLYERDREFSREDLARQELSAEYTELYKQYRETVTPAVPPKTDVSKYVDSNLRFLFIPTHFLFVAPDGKADNPGTVEEPFSTLMQARDAIRKLKAERTFPTTGEIRVIVRGGLYPVTETFVLETQDSGTENVPIIYTAATGETPIFSGGVSVSQFTKVEENTILNRLPEEGNGNVWTATIPPGTVFPPIAPRGFGKNGLGAAPAVELFVDDKPLQIARYPNAPKPGAENVLKESENAFMQTGKVHRGFFNTPEKDQPGIFEYSDARHERWTDAEDAMLFGYWGHLWGITSGVIEKIDTETKQVVLATNNHYGYRENMPYYAFNLLEEIDEPGEWYLDRKNEKLYVYPPDGIDLNTAKVRLSQFSDRFVVAREVSYVSLAGLHFEEGTGTAIRIEGGENFNIVGCSIKRFGNWGLGISGKNHKVLACNFITLGGGGIALNGGNIQMLTPGNNLVENTFVNDFSRIDRCYAPAIDIAGVGNRVAYNLFCDSPGHAIRIGGMEHIVEFNEVHSIVYESDDQSGIDIWGNPFIRGMVYRYNYWHHIGSGRDVAGQAGIRLDDMISSVLMYGNVFLRASGGQFGGVQIHGGKDNIVDGNLMIDCKYAVSFSPWGQRRWLEQLDGFFATQSRQQGFDPDSEIYKAKYPDFAELELNADRNFVTRNAAIAVDTLANNSRRNVMLSNIMIPWMPELFTETRGMTMGGTQRVPADAREIRRRLSIPMNSPLYQLWDIPPIPMESMGLYVDEIRKEIPTTPITPFFVLE